MSKSDACETDLLKAIFNNTAWGTLVAAGSATVLYAALHTGDPGETGNQTTSEATYTGYTRVSVTRSSGFTVTGNSVSPAADITFPAGTGGSGTITFFSIGTASTGTGEILYSGAVSPSIVTGSGYTPILKAATAITED